LPSPLRKRTASIRKLKRRRVHLLDLLVVAKNARESYTIPKATSALLFAHLSVALLLLHHTT
jgi:hypothetical protein